ncbi:hypothetical protein [Streptomyces sp. NPDC005573]|uniref:hypothetical protein n=1 Tax=Streptomyces sp. NPDC005573 TaxID=3156890 RepID=UPI0033B82AD5
MAVAAFRALDALVFLTAGVWILRRGRGRRANTLAGWGAVAIGLGAALHGAGELAGDRHPLGPVLAVCSAASNLAGAALVVAAARTSGRGRSWRKRHRLPPSRP